jgi:hypothetical protein
MQELGEKGLCMNRPGLTEFEMFILYALVLSKCKDFKTCIRLNQTQILKLVQQSGADKSVKKIKKHTMQVFTQIF